MSQPACGNLEPHLPHNGFATANPDPWCKGVGEEAEGRELLRQVKAYAALPDTVVKLSWAWNLTNGTTEHGVQLLGPRKKRLGPFIAHSEEHPNTPAGALRSLADILEAE